MPQVLVLYAVVSLVQAAIAAQRGWLLAMSGATFLFLMVLFAWWKISKEDQSKDIEKQ